MATIVIPKVNWHIALADAIKTAEAGDTIVVHSDAMRNLAESAKERMNRPDLTIELSNN